MAKILIADDRSADRLYLVTLLGYQGHTLLEAADGEQALRLVRAERPDLVIADVRMPYMDGFEFLAALRADASVAHIPVIILSSQDDWEERGRDCGANAHLTKPIHLDGLLAAVARQLGERALTSREPAYLRQASTPDQKLVRLVDVLTDLDL